MLGDQRLQCGRVQQGDVTGGHDDGAVQVPRKRRQAAGHGAPGPGDLILVRGHSIRSDLSQVSDDGVTLVTHDDDEVLGVQSTSGTDCVADEAASTDAVQDLRGGRTHAGSLTGSHDDDGSGGSGYHGSSSRW